MRSKKGNVVIVVVGLLAFVLVLAAALLYPRFLKKETPETVSRAIEPKTEYENPFDQKTQYANPFSAYKNPFDNLE